MLKNRAGFNFYTIIDKLDNEVNKNKSYDYIFDNINDSNSNSCVDNNFNYSVAIERPLRFIILGDGGSKGNHSFTNIIIKPCDVYGSASSTLDMCIFGATIEDTESSLVTRKHTRSFFDEAYKTESKTLTRQIPIQHKQRGCNINFNIDYRPKYGTIGDGKFSAILFGMKGPASNEPLYRGIIECQDKSKNDKRYKNGTRFLLAGFEREWADPEPWLYGEPKPQSDEYFRLTTDDDIALYLTPINNAVNVEKDRREKAGIAPMNYDEEHKLRLKHSINCPCVENPIAKHIDEPDTSWYHSVARPMSAIICWNITIIFNRQYTQSILNVIGLYNNQTGLKSIGNTIQPLFEQNKNQSKPLSILVCVYDSILNARRCLL